MFVATCCRDYVSYSTGTKDSETRAYQFSVDSRAFPSKNGALSNEIIAPFNNIVYPHIHTQQPNMDQDSAA